MAARKAGHRKVSVTDNPLKISKRCTAHSKRREDVAKLMKFADDGIASKNITFCGPYGRRKGIFQIFKKFVNKSVTSQLLFCRGTRTKFVYKILTTPYSFKKMLGSG